MIILRIVNMTKIKDLSIIILIAFIIASILYGIHMFRYEFIETNNGNLVIRYDRITNTQCLSSALLSTEVRTVDGYNEDTLLHFCNIEKD